MRYSSVCLAFCVFLIAGCQSPLGGGSDSAAPLPDAMEGGPTDLPGNADGREDRSSQSEINPDAADGEHRAAMRRFTFKAMGGISMGACGLAFHAHNPGRLDVVSALGGYINFHYLYRAIGTAMVGGFCDMETILAHLDELNDPSVLELDCGYVPPDNKWEHPVKFNHWQYDDSGGDWHRDGYWDPIEGLFTAFGNFLYHNPDHPYLPPGVPAAWVTPGNDKEKCANAIHVGKPHNYNAEFNPDGEFDLITFCDGEEPVPGDEDNPDYWDLMGAYDPTYEHTRPVPLVLAVDYNGNGKRDYHEPIAINAAERFDDTGTDGCLDQDEDGDGGCGGGGTGDDPNKDNYDIEAAPFGTQGDHFRQEGESYRDFGVDGVDGTGDYGEGDGQFTMNANLERILSIDVIHWADTAPLEELEAVDVILDGGIRDAFGSLSGMFPIATHLAARIPNTRIYDGYAGAPTSLAHAPADSILLLIADNLKWDAASMGKNFIIRYGNWEATEKQIADGDGKHLGSSSDIVNRLCISMLTPLNRWPETDRTPCVSPKGTTLNRTFFSKALANRYQYSISLPPCYDTSDLRYPVMFFLPGHGMTAADTVAGAVAFNILMEGGHVAKFLTVVPEGQCCRINVDSGERYCACTKNKEAGGWDCEDPSCTAASGECAIVQIPSSSLRQECNGGHFFANQLSNRFGDVEAAGLMNYEAMLLDLIEEVDANFRTRPPADYPIPR